MMTKMNALQHATITSPKKIYVELTTRCNLQCAMCVKHTAGSCIPEKDMTSAAFHHILPALPTLDSLILNGIGESLLHPELIDFVTLARKNMAAEATIGLQSNGLLLNKDLARHLIRAGLSTLCLSVDHVDQTISQKQQAHSFSAVARAVAHLQQAKIRENSDFKIGLEIVLTKDTIGDLPRLVEWAVAHGIDYILASHLICYDSTAEQQCLFTPHPPEATTLYEKFRDKVSAVGGDFDQELLHYRRHVGTRSTPAFLEIMRDMVAEAKRLDLQLNIAELSQNDLRHGEKLKQLIARAQAQAQGTELDLFIPSLQATSERKCRFMDEHAVFIDVNGDVMPCHFLWHSYSCRILKENAEVTKRSFGNICNRSLDTIWRSAPYTDFREEAGGYDYTHCWTCTQGPCTTLLADDGDYAKDCYGSQVPCGHCLWNLGGLRCL